MVSLIHESAPIMITNQIWALIVCEGFFPRYESHLPFEVVFGKFLLQHLKTQLVWGPRPEESIQMKYIKYSQNTACVKAQVWGKYSDEKY